jgi:dCTP deaminase
MRITPDPRSDAVVWSSTALDLRLEGQFSCWNLAADDESVSFSPADPGYDFPTLVERYSRRVDMPAEGFPIERGQLYLGWTVERIQLPYRSRLAARVEGKSNLARLGLGIHVTAPTIHAGFGYDDTNPEFLGNPIQLEIWNTGPRPIILKTGMRICQLIFEQVDGTPEQGYAGQFAIQGPVS